MSLARTRLQVTATFTLLAALVIVSLAWFTVETGTDAIAKGAERRLALDAAAIIADGAEDASARNTWIVNAKAESSTSLGERVVEPPIYTLAQRAGDSGRYEVIRQGVRWLTYAQPINAEDHVVTVLQLTAYDRDAQELTQRVWGAAGGSILLIALIGWWVSGRSLRPAHQAIRQQKDFIADAAHELRTPLAVIRASASHTLSRTRDAEAYRESLDEILTAAERAGSGVDELLELARLEAGQLDLRLAPVRVDLLAIEAATGMRFDKSKVTADAGAAATVQGDRALLVQLLDGLIRNAAARASQVEVSSWTDDDTAVIQVADNGPGFDPVLLPHIFDRFRRGDSKGSAGLGMAIARRIVEAHGGHCEASNRDEGGAVVRVMLPVLA